MASGKPQFVHTLCAWSANSSTYDANGNLVTGSGRIFAWTADNRPMSITSGDGVVETNASTTPRGQRVLHTREGGYVGDAEPSVGGGPGDGRPLPGLFTLIGVTSE